MSYEWTVNFNNLVSFFLLYFKPLIHDLWNNSCIMFERVFEILTWDEAIYQQIGLIMMHVCNNIPTKTVQNRNLFYSNLRCSSLKNKAIFSSCWKWMVILWKPFFSKCQNFRYSGDNYEMLLRILTTLSVGLEYTNNLLQKSDVLHNTLNCIWW